MSESTAPAAAPPREPDERSRAVADAIAGQLMPRLDATVEQKVREAAAAMPAQIGEETLANYFKSEQFQNAQRETVAAEVQDAIAKLGIPPAFRGAGGPPDEDDADAKLSTLFAGGRLPSYLFDPSKPNPDAVGAQLDGRFSSWTDLLRTIKRAQNGDRDERLAWVRDNGTIAADLSGEDLASGGALVPEEFRAALLEVGLMDAIIRPRAFTIPMGSASAKLPALTDTDHSTSLWGGVVANWTGPGASITETQPRFRNVLLNAHGLKLYTEIENELLQDSFISFSALIARMFGGAATFYEEAAFINGDGVGKPLGITNAACRVGVTRNAGGLAIEIPDLAGMYARMLPQSQGRAVWIVSPAVLGDLLQIESTAGAQAIVRNIGGDTITSIYGRPVLVSEHAPNLASANDIMFVDLSFYLIGDRQALSLATSVAAGFQNDRTAVRGVERLDAQPWLQSAITPANGGATLSPIVGLNA